MGPGGLLNSQDLFNIALGNGTILLNFRRRVPNKWEWL